MFWFFTAIVVDPRITPLVNGPRTTDNGHGVQDERTMHVAFFLP